MNLSSAEHDKGDVFPRSTSIYFQLEDAHGESQACFWWKFIQSVSRSLTGTATSLAGETSLSRPRRTTALVGSCTLVAPRNTTRGPDHLSSHQSEHDINASMRKNLPFQSWSGLSHGRSKTIPRKPTCHQSALRSCLCLPGDTTESDNLTITICKKHPSVKVPRERLTLGGIMQQDFQAESCSRHNWEQPQFAGWRSGACFKHRTESRWPCYCEETGVWSQTPQSQQNNLRCYRVSKTKATTRLSCIFLALCHFKTCRGCDKTPTHRSL